MKHAQGHSNWTTNPSLSQHWLGSTLHALAMLVLYVVKFFSMRPSRHAAECHSEAMPEALPCENSDTAKETLFVATNDEPQEGLMVSSEPDECPAQRPSNHEAALTSRGSSRNRAYLAIPLRLATKTSRSTSPYRFATWGGKAERASGSSRWRGIASISRNATGGGGQTRACAAGRRGSRVHPRRPTRA